MFVRDKINNFSNFVGVIKIKISFVLHVVKIINSSP